MFGSTTLLLHDNHHADSQLMMWRPPLDLGDKKTLWQHSGGSGTPHFWISLLFHSGTHHTGAPPLLVLL